MTNSKDGGAFFFQAEDGIRDGRVTGVQTCALPISRKITSKVCHSPGGLLAFIDGGRPTKSGLGSLQLAYTPPQSPYFGCFTPQLSSTWISRSEERRVGKDGRSRCSSYD